MAFTITAAAGNAKVDVLCRLDATAGGTYTAPISVDVANSSLPSWVNTLIDGATVMLWGTPTVAGDVSCVLTVKDSSGTPQSATTTFTIPVELPSPPVGVVNAHRAIPGGNGVLLNDDSAAIWNTSIALPNSTQQTQVLGVVTTNDAVFTLTAPTFAASGTVTTTAGTIIVSAVLSDSFSFSGSIEGTGIWVLADSFSFSSDLEPLWTAVQTLSDTFTIDDVLSALIKATASDSFTFTASPTAWMVLAKKLRDSLQITGAASKTVDLHVAIALSFALRDAVIDAQGSFLSDTLALHDSLLATANHIVNLLDSLQLSAAATGNVILQAFVADTFSLGDDVTGTAEVLQALADAFGFTATFYTGQDTYTAWVMTPESRAMRQYTNYPFNSYALLFGRFYGAASDGVYLLEGDTDNGALITGSVRTGLLDFNSRQMKRMDRLYLGYRSDGTLCLRACVTSPTGTKEEYTYKMVAKPADAAREQRIPIGRGLKSVYWQFELDNSADGSSFELSDITVLPMILTRKV